jgi:hypothetical protein
MDRQTATTSSPRGMKPVTRRGRITAAIIAAIVLISAGAYLAGQYSSARRPATLGDLPQYPYTGSEFPPNQLSPQQRSEAEANVRALANNVAPDYHIKSERLLACTGAFIWDAVRSSLTGYLSPRGFGIQSSGQLPDTAADPAYIMWARTNWLQKLLNNKRIMAIGMQQPLQAGQPSTPVHLYAYLELAANT